MCWTLITCGEAFLVFRNCSWLSQLIVHVCSLIVRLMVLATGVNYYSYATIFLGHSYQKFQSKQHKFVSFNRQRFKIIEFFFLQPYLPSIVSFYSYIVRRVCSVFNFRRMCMRLFSVSICKRRLLSSAFYLCFSLFLSQSIIFENDQACVNALHSVFEG